MRAFRRLLLLTLFAVAGVALALGVGLFSQPPAPSAAAAGRPAVSQEGQTAKEARSSTSSAVPAPSSHSQPAEVLRAESGADTAAAKAAVAKQASAKAIPSSTGPRKDEAKASPAKPLSRNAEENSTKAATKSAPTKTEEAHAAHAPKAEPIDDMPAVQEPVVSRTPLADSSNSQGQLSDPYPRLARLLKSGSGSSEPAPKNKKASGVPSATGTPDFLQSAVPAEPLPAPPGVRWPTPTAAPLPADKSAAKRAVESLLPIAPGAGVPRPSEPAPLADAPGKNPVTRITKGNGDNQLSMHIQNADIREVLELLSEKGNLNILAGNAVQGKVSAVLRGVDVDSALKAILKSTGLVCRREGKFIYVGTPQEFAQIEQSLDQLGTRVYRPNYVTAEELKTLVTPLLTANTGTAAVSTPPEKGIASTTEANGNSFAGGDALLVRDYEAVLTQVDQVVAEVDVRPLQVSIEAMILSVKLSDGNDFGVNFQLLHGDHMKFGWGTIPNQAGAVKMTDKVTVPTSATALDGLTSVLLNGGLKFGYLDSNVGLYINALESIGDTNVIATPRVTVLNKQRAYVHIGEKLGYISTTVTETASTSSVEFLDVGTELRLRPFISRDGLIRMEVHPELSTGSVDKEENYTIPNKEVTEVTTNVIVRDGCTAVIGGLIRNQLATTASQVPVLGSLPLVGALFRGSSETTERHEIIVLLTPRIIYDQESAREGDQQACEYHRRQAVYAEKMNPFSKRWIARRYFRLAQSAWAQGDRDRALRFAELAVHFDPLNRAAIDLRSDIWLNKRVGNHTSPCPSEAPSAPLDGQAVAPWLLSDLEHEPVQQAAALPHPMDPGRPGERVDIKRPQVLQP